MSNKPLVSIIVLNWNGKHFLSRCLSSLLDQDYPNYEVLLVDNGSTDGSVEFVKRMFGEDPRLKIISLDKNYGFSKGNNMGISKAKGKYVIVLNNDTEVKPNFISELVKVAENSDEIGSVSCRILTYDGGTWYGQYFTNKGFYRPIFYPKHLKKTLRQSLRSFLSKSC